MRYEGGQPLPEKRLHPLSWVFQLVGSLGAVIPIGVAVALGADPATILGAVTPVPDTLSEYGFAGLLRGSRTELSLIHI